MQAQCSDGTNAQKRHTHTHCALLALSSKVLIEIAYADNSDSHPQTKTLKGYYAATPTVLSLEAWYARQVLSRNVSSTLGTTLGMVTSGSAFKKSSVTGFTLTWRWRLETKAQAVAETVLTQETNSAIRFEMGFQLAQNGQQPNPLAHTHSQSKLSEHR